MLPFSIQCHTAPLHSYPYIIPFIQYEQNTLYTTWTQLPDKSFWLRVRIWINFITDLVKKLIFTLQCFANNLPLQSDTIWLHWPVCWHVILVIVVPSWKLIPATHVYVTTASSPYTSDSKFVAFSILTGLAHLMAKYILVINSMIPRMQTTQY